jgi:hypothetical protein
VGPSHTPEGTQELRPHHHFALHWGCWSWGAHPLRYMPGRTWTHPSFCLATLRAARDASCSHVQGCPNKMPKLDAGCPNKMPKLDAGCPNKMTKRDAGCPNILPKLDAGCPKILPKLDAGCPNKMRLPFVQTAGHCVTPHPRTHVHSNA